VSETRVKPSIGLIILACDILASSFPFKFGLVRAPILCKSPANRPVDLWEIEEKCGKGG
jgi:hypothetical protein